MKKFQDVNSSRPAYATIWDVLLTPSPFRNILLSSVRTNLPKTESISNPNGRVITGRPEIHACLVPYLVSSVEPVSHPEEIVELEAVRRAHMEDRLRGRWNRTLNAGSRYHDVKSPLNPFLEDKDVELALVVFLTFYSLWWPADADVFTLGREKSSLGKNHMPTWVLRELHLST